MEASWLGGSAGVGFEDGTGFFFFFAYLEILEEGLMPLSLRPPPTAAV